MQAKTNFSELINLIENCEGNVYVLCDENTQQCCYDIFCKQIGLKLPVITIKAGEEHKSIANCELIWQKMLHDKADKNTLLINLGGGVVSDIGGFAAATYKRGIKYVNVPTSLLAMVDAAAGGKTGINFGHFKNMIGVIQQPEMVVLHFPFLNTLSAQHIKNGFAEMLKHAILNGKAELNEMLTFDDIKSHLNEAIILKSLAIKENIVAQDPQEAGLRKILNFGHTLGHAIEYAAQESKQTILHGEAIAIGMIAALKLSVIKLNFNKDEADSIIKFIHKNFPTPSWLKDRHNLILQAVLQDKKNSNQNVKMVLIQDLGKPIYDVVVSLQEIENVLLELN